MLSTSQPDRISLRLDRKGQTSQAQVSKFLQFNLGATDYALIEAEIVTEVITVSQTEILSVPQMPYCVLGVYSWRSEMLWIVDLENLLGYPPLPNLDVSLDPLTYMVLVVQIEGQALGLVVPRVNNLVQFGASELKPPILELFSDDLLQFLQGYFTDDCNNILMLLNVEAILNSF
jgi:positive phototaxis protein PixI